PQDISVIRPPILFPSAGPEKSTDNPTNSTPLLIDKPDSKQDKRTLLSRLNPFGGKTKAAARERTPDSPAEISNDNPVVVAINPTNLLLAPVSVPAAPAFPRYTYLSPTKPISG